VEERTAELDELLEEQKALLSTIPAFVYFKDKNGNYIAANKAFADKTGTSVDEIAGKTDYDFFPKAQADAHRAYDYEVMESGEPKYDIAVRACNDCSAVFAAPLCIQTSGKTDCAALIMRFDVAECTECCKLGDAATEIILRGFVL